MAAKLNRRAALVALWSAMRAQQRGGHSLGERLAALPRMLWHTLTGRYDGKWRLLLMGAATAYVVSPIDLIPEAFLFLVGLIDDAVVLVWLAGAVLSETERFLEWEASRPAPPAGPPRRAFVPLRTR
jgi:uncharacterized membrane protein YkvA (DUF1232 family)